MLNVSQIDRIEKQVQLAGISFSHLPDDLIDHICCDVETRMDKGETFDQAFEKVKVEIGIERTKTGMGEYFRLPRIDRIFTQFVMGDHALARSYLAGNPFLDTNSGLFPSGICGQHG